jgi:N-acetylglutamate synthase-like GNAT family acetyltransferase
MIIAMIKKRGKKLIITLSPYNVHPNQKEKEFKISAFYKETKKIEVGDLEYSILMKKDGFPKEIHVNNIDVVEKLQKKGYGKILMGFCQAIAQASGLRITLFSLADVVGFYRKCGFHSACRGSQDMIWYPRKNSLRESQKR